MFVTIINDCNDNNALARQEVLTSTLFPYAHITTLGIPFGNTLEAAGNLVDILNVADPNKGIILVNSAPRHKKKWPNGTPFGYFWFNQILVVATVDEYTLSLAKKLNLIRKLYITDIKEVMGRYGENPTMKNQIINSQFRSLDYSPRLAYWLYKQYDVPSQEYSLDNIPDAPNAIWHIDNFGNCKTTFTENDEIWQEGKQTQYLCIRHLKDVPANQLALTVGSSGFGAHRFLEIVINGGNAAKELRFSSGQLLQ